MANSSFETTAGHMAEAVKQLGLEADTPVEIIVKLSDPEKIARLNALLEEGDQGKAESPEPLDKRLARLQARHATM